MESSLLARYQDHLSETKGSIFSQPWWWKTVTGQYPSIAVKAGQDGHIQAAFPYYHGKKAGLLSWIKMPPLTPYIEFSFAAKPGKETTIQRHKEKCIDHIMTALPSSHYFNILLHPDTPAINWSALGIKSKLELTYCLPEIEDHDFLFSQFESSARNHIRSAEKRLTIRSASATELHELLDKTFSKQKLKSPFSIEFITRLLLQLEKNGNYLLLCATDSDNKIHAANLTVFDHHTAYNLLTGSDPALHKSGAVPFLLWSTIRRVSASVQTFDFEGGMLPNIASLYRSLGGQKRSYVRLYGSKNRLLTGALTMMGKF